MKSGHDTKYDDKKNYIFLIVLFLFFFFLMGHFWGFYFVTASVLA